MVILAGVWLPWSVQRLGEVAHQDGAGSSFKMSFASPVSSTTYGLDTYQGWVVLRLPLLALSVGSLMSGRGRVTGWPQLAVGLVVCAVALHLILRPHAIGNASGLVASGGFLGALQDASKKSGETHVGPGLYLVLGGGFLFSLSSVLSLSGRRA